MLPQQLSVCLRQYLDTSSAFFTKFASMPPYVNHTLVKSFVLDSITQVEQVEVQQGTSEIRPPVLSSFITSENEMELEFKRAFSHVKIIRDRVFKTVMKYFLRFVAFHMHPVMQIPQKRAFWRQLFEFFFLNDNAVSWHRQGGPDIFGFQETIHFLKNSHFQDLFSYWLLKQFFSHSHHVNSSFVQLYNWVDKCSDLIWAQEEPAVNEHSVRQFSQEESEVLNLTLHISNDDEALFVAYFEEINWSEQMDPMPQSYIEELHQRDFIFTQNGMSTPLSNLETATSRFVESAVESENEVEEQQVLNMIDELEKEIDIVVFSKLNP